MRIKYTSAIVACEATYLVYSTTPQINLTTPNSGTSWETGTTHAINWIKNGSMDTMVKIELLKGGSKIIDIAASTANDGSYDWLVPITLTAGGDYMARVTTADDAHGDDSDLFAITVTLPAITITAPATGANWGIGTTQAITWTKTGILDANVKIELYKGGVKTLDIIASTANDGNYDWLVPATLTDGGDYVLRVTTADDAVSDDSGAFNISTIPTITVTSPAAGVVWKRRTNQTIAWAKTGAQGSTVKIRLYRNGALKLAIVSSTANDGIHVWKVKGTLPRGSGYQIRVNTTDLKVDDYSDSFSIN
jgi:hypothetical protein